MAVTRRAAAAAALVLVVAAAVGAWYFDARTHPRAVVERLVDRLEARDRRGTVSEIAPGYLRSVLASGQSIDVVLAPVIATCSRDRFACTEAIDASVADVAGLEAALTHARLADVRAVVVGEPTPGYRLGFVTAPLIGPLEIRYVLSSGTALGFVTSTLANRLDATPARLREAAVAGLRADGDARLEKLAVTAADIRRVITKGDPVAELLDVERMRAIAASLDAPRLYCAVPARGTLLVARADDAARDALTTLVAKERGPRLRPGDVGLLVFDVAGTGDRALSLFNPSS